MPIQYCAMGRLARHDDGIDCEKLGSERSLSGMRSVSGRSVVRGEGGCGDAVDCVGGGWCTCSDSYAAAVCLVGVGALASVSWPDHACVHWSPRSPAVPAATSENIPKSSE